MSDAPCAALPAPINIMRSANRLRERMRPQDPKDLAFELVSDALPNEFLCGDLTVTNQQLESLAKAKSWYIDGTFKVVRKPFQQLVSINAFIKSGKCLKQVPMVFVVMPGKKRSDYKKVCMNNVIF